ncbi:AraC family transcriptional regulator [Pseudomonas putida]|nr:AraC family transcriptional regulator [Pseudomonas putida]
MHGGGAASGAKPELRVAFILMNHFTLIPVAGLVESLRFAADEFCSNRQIYCQWDWMTLDDLPVTASCGMRIAPTRSLSDLDGYDYVVLAGGLLDEALNAPDWLSVLLRTLLLNGKPIIALSSASFVLAEAGLLEGRRCAVHFTASDEFVNRYPHTEVIIDECFVDDGNIISCSGGTAIELAAMLIRRHCGAMRASRGLDYLLLDAKPASAAPSRSQPNLRRMFKNHFVERAIAYMREHLDTPSSLQALADELGVQERKLHRAFIDSTKVTPAQFWRDLRLTHAKELLVNTDQHVTKIAKLTGFTDASHFTLWFRKTFNETPCSFRKRRRHVDSAFCSRPRSLASAGLT